MLRAVLVALASFGCAMCQDMDPPSWVDFGTSSYGIANGARNWQGADANCRAWGGTLVSVLSPEELKFIQEKIDEQGVGSFWIGLNRLDQTIWKWSDQQQNVPNYWADGYPTDGTDYKLCAYQENSLWYNQHCDTSRGFVCKAGQTSGTRSPLTVPPTQTVTGYCPSGYFGIPDDNKCFKMFFKTDNDGYTWDEARDHCRAVAGVLRPDIASIENPLQAALLTTEMIDYTIGLYIGLKRDNSHTSRSEWKWADNAAFDYNNWAPNEPSYGYNDNCAEMWYNSGPPGTWNNIPCDRKRGYVCQAYKNPQNIISTPNPGYPLQCKEGFVPYVNACYMFVNTTGTWDALETKCKSMQANLASIHNEAENAALMAGVILNSDGKRVWIGLRDYKGQGGFEWSDSWHAYYTKWGNGEPSSVGDNGGGCVSMDVDGRWYDVDCNLNMGGICKYTSEPPITTPVPKMGACPGEQYGSTDWDKWDSNCYLFVSRSRSWQDAKEYCLSLDPLASLVSIHSFQENEHVFRLDTSSRPNSIWLGMYRRSISGDFAWTTNDAVIYENWAPGEPNSDGTEECVEMYTGTTYPKQWNDMACSRSRSFVCKTPQGVRLTPPPHVEGTCPEGWVGYGAKCYLFEATSIALWTTAQQRCQAAGGNLAKINNNFEQQFIHTQMTDRNEFPVGEGWDYWIGLVKDKEQEPQEGEYYFKWVDGSEFLPDMYTHWNDGEPNDWDGIEDCVEVYRRNGESRDGYWNDVRCDETRAYVCEIDKELTESAANLSSGSIVGIVFGVLAILLLVIAIVVAIMDKNCSARVQQGVDGTKKLFKGGGGGISNDNYKEFDNENSFANHSAGEKSDSLA